MVTKFTFVNTLESMAHDTLFLHGVIQSIPQLFYSHSKYNSLQYTYYRVTY